MTTSSLIRPISYIVCCIFISNLFIHSITAQNTAKQPLDVMMFLDRGNKSDPKEPPDIICRYFTIATAQQAAPIITTGTTLHSFLSKRLEWGGISSKFKRFMALIIQRLTPKTVTDFYFGQSKNFYRLVFSQIPFTDENFEVFEYAQEDMFLIIPNRYKDRISTMLPSLGFNIPLASPTASKRTILKKVSISELEERIAKEAWQPLLNGNEITSKTIETFFIHNKNLGSWNLYLLGHGSKLDKIAFLYIDEFKKLLLFLENKLSTSFLYYLTCYGGGYNTILAFMEKITDRVKKIAKSIQINFVIASGSATDAPATASQIGLAKTSAGQTTTPLCTEQTCPGNKLLQSIKSPLDFNLFFELLHNPFSSDQPISKDSWIKIFKSINPIKSRGGAKNIPLIKFPGQPFIPVTGINENSVFISYEKVKKHEEENRPIEIKKANQTKSILLSPSIINAPIHIDTTSEIHFLSLITGISLHHISNLTIGKNTFLQEKQRNPEHSMLNSIASFFMLKPLSLGFTKYFVIKTLVFKGNKYTNMIIQRHPRNLPYIPNGTVLFQWGNHFYKAVWHTEKSPIPLYKILRPKISELSAAEFRQEAETLLYEWYNASAPFYRFEEKSSGKVYDYELLEYVKDRLDIFNDNTEEEISLLSQAMVRPKDLLRPFSIPMCSLHAMQPRIPLAFSSIRI